MECPLPIDWLDWIEDPTDALLSEHLAGCLSCRTLIGLVSQNDVELSFPGPLAPVPATFFVEEARTNPPATGEFWITAPVDAELDSALVLVLDERHHEFDRGWHEIAGADTFTENATELDLLLDRADTDASVPLRVRFDLQGYVAESDLRHRVAALTATGRTIVAAALDGTVDESRWGLPIEGPHDERLLQPDTSAAVVRQLQILYRARTAAAEDADLTFAAVLKQARTERDLTRARVARNLADRVGLAALTTKVKRYYADLENGLLAPARLRPELIVALARTLGLPWRELEALRDAWRPPAAHATAPIFARSSSSSTEPAPKPVAQQWDAVDDLFLGGNET